MKIGYFQNTLYFHNILDIFKMSISGSKVSKRDRIKKFVYFLSLVLLSVLN